MTHSPTDSLTPPPATPWADSPATLNLRPPGRPTRIAQFDVVRELGRGGMGVVYEGFDARLKRRAAVKVLRDDGTFGADAEARFRTEAEAVAALHHPNIVQIYEVGYYRVPGASGEGLGRPFVAFEYLPGESLFARARGKPQPPSWAAAVVAPLAAAVAHAHAAGVVHRDIKPANVLFDAEGTPKLTDFGAARLDAPSGAGPVTQAGEVVGTPQYMAPEQATGRAGAAAPAVDVYALGALLYDLLTGRPPFDGPDPLGVLGMVVHDDPLPPRRLQPKVPRDLETICLKCLEKNPAARYATASDVAADLNRFLAGESIRARPDGAVARVLKKARRRPVEAGLIAAVLAVSAIGLGGVLYQWRDAVAAHADARARALDARAAGADAERSRDEANAAKGDAERARDAAERDLYRARVSEAALMLAGGDTPRATDLLAAAAPKDGRPDGRGWEYHFLTAQCRNHLWNNTLEDATDAGLWPHALAVSPDGARVAVAAGNPYNDDTAWDTRAEATVYVFRAADGRREVVVRDAFPQAVLKMVWDGPDRLVLGGRTAGVRAYAVPSGRRVLDWAGRVPTGMVVHHDHCVALSDDGRVAVRSAADDAVEWLDVRTGKVTGRATVANPPGGVCRPLFVTPAGRVAIQGRNLGVVVLDPDGRERLRLADAGCGTFDPAGRRLVATARVGERWAFGVWDTDSGKPLWERPPGDTAGGPYQFTPDGRRLVDLHVHRGLVKVWDAAAGTCRGELHGHAGVVWDAKASPDGRWAATAGNDGTVRLWNLEHMSEVARFPAHRTGSRVLAFDPAGWRLVTGGMDFRAAAWDLTRERADGTNLPGRSDGTGGGAYYAGVWADPVGRVRVVDTTHGRLTELDPATAAPVRVVRLAGLTRRPEKVATDFALSADGRRLLGPADAASGDPRLTVWDTATGEAVRTLPTTPRGRIVTAALSADGALAAASFIAAPKAKGEPPTRGFRVWDADTGAERFAETPDGFNYTSAAFAPDGRLVLGIASMKSARRGVEVLDLGTGDRTALPFDAKASAFWCLAVSPDGTRVVGANLSNEERELRAWNLATGRVEWAETDLRSSPTGLTFTPDGRQVVTVRQDDTLVVRDAATGDEVFRKAVRVGRFGDYAYPARAAVAADGRSVVTYHSNGGLSVWRTDGSDDPDRSAANRRADADAGRFFFHLRAARELSGDRACVGYRLHAAALDALPVPNEYLKGEWERVRSGR